MKLGHLKGYYRNRKPVADSLPSLMLVVEGCVMRVVEYSWDH